MDKLKNLKEFGCADKYVKKAHKAGLYTLEDFTPEMLKKLLDINGQFKREEALAIEKRLSSKSPAVSDDYVEAAHKAGLHTLEDFTDGMCIDRLNEIWVTAFDKTHPILMEFRNRVAGKNDDYAEDAHDAGFYTVEDFTSGMINKGEKKCRILWFQNSPKYNAEEHQAILNEVQRRFEMLVEAGVYDKKLLMKAGVLSETLER